jgi:hypothetical protein
MTAAERQKLKLLALVAVIGGGYLLLRPGPAPLSTLPTGQSRARNGRPPADFNFVARLPEIPLDQLDQPRTRFALGRNLFRYPPPPPPPPPSPEELARLRKEAAETARRRALEPPPKILPTIDFKFAGYVETPKGKIAALSRGDQIVLAREGEVLDHRFKIVRIGFESITVGFVGEDATRQLPITGN